jgi:hypothetical protein
MPINVDGRAGIGWSMAMALGDCELLVRQPAGTNVNPPAFDR